MIPVGTLLAGKYRVERVLGQGGMGVVVAALHIHLNQRVAMKFLLPEVLQNQDVVQRFIREARASAALRGEHVCRVSDVGTLETGAPYIVMELLEGSDLATLVANHGAMPVPMAVDHILQACLGVGEAHSLGIVHRDLKPANLFLTRRPDGGPLIKVLDFGIAKAQHDANFQLTRTSAVMGSPGYMSPEQLRSSRDCDARSDIWSIGVILFELVSGRPPFGGESITELALHIAIDPTPPMPLALPPGFEQVVQRCLAKEPAQRFPDLATLAQALVPFGGAHAREVAAGVSRILNVAPGSMTVLAPMPATATPTTLGASVGAMPSAAGGARWKWPAIGAVAVAALAVVAVVATRSPGNSEVKPAAPPAAATAPAASPAAVAPAAAAPASPPPPVPAATPPPVDAALPIDAPLAIDAALPDAASQPVRTNKQPKPPKTPNPSKTEDLGDDRL